MEATQKMTMMNFEEVTIVTQDTPLSVLRPVRKTLTHRHTHIHHRTRRRRIKQNTQRDRLPDLNFFLNRRALSLTVFVCVFRACVFLFLIQYFRPDW